MMALPRANETTTLKVARQIGLDIDQLLADMEAPEIDAHIAVSMSLTEELGFQGTPSFVIGNATAGGLLQLEQMKNMVARVRSENE